MDMLVKLYDRDARFSAVAPPLIETLVLRRAMVAEAPVISSWVTKLFGLGWASEATAAAGRTPTTCLLALQGEAIRGFACWDVAALGFFGPLGVDPDFARRGIGTALTNLALEAMRHQGYGYAVIGGVADPKFYGRIVEAVPIEGSTPGLYRGLLRGLT